MSFITGTPLYKERVWGGKYLTTFLNREIIAQNPIGESWEIVDHPTAQSVITIGGIGMTLRDFIRRNGRWVMGPSWNCDDSFPLLVKWLDCRELLSVQVHPSEEAAHQFGGELKPEFWYIARAKPDARIFMGLKNGTTRKMFEQAIKKGGVANCLHAIESKKDGCVYIPSGRVHAIGAGNLILEIQAVSDSTYRVYDWDRQGLSGKPRKLHIQEALASIDFDDHEPTMLDVNACGVLVDSTHFRVQKFMINADSAPVLFSAGDQPRMIHMIDGDIQDACSGAILKKGANAILPFAQDFELITSIHATFLITDRFV